MAAFRDWNEETGTAPREVAERSLSHAVKDETEEAYLRGDMLERRRKLMEAWAKHCTGGKAGAKVLPMRRRAVA